MNAYIISWHDELVITLRVSAVEGIPVRDIQRQITYSQLMVTNLFFIIAKVHAAAPKKVVAKKAAQDCQEGQEGCPQEGCCQEARCQEGRCQEMITTQN